MSFIKLDEENQKKADHLYELEKEILHFIDFLGSNRWLAIGRTDIEKGFMALRKGITENFKDKNASITN